MDPIEMTYFSGIFSIFENFLFNLQEIAAPYSPKKPQYGHSALPLNTR